MVAKIRNMPERMHSVEGPGLDYDTIERLAVSELEQLVTELKGDALTIMHDAGSGHPGTVLSGLRARLVYHWTIGDRPYHVSNGHSVPIDVVIGHRFGNISDVEMANFRNILLSGHNEARTQPVPSGLLGQGPGIANGYARAELLRETGRRIYCFCGDGETDEGAVWEAFEDAATNGLDVCYVINGNRKNLTGSLVHPLETKIKAWEALGIRIIVADNKVAALAEAYNKAESADGPVAIVVDSVKGEGVSFMEGEPSGWHGNPITDEQYEHAMQELGLEPTTFKRPESRIRVARDSGVAAAIDMLESKGIGSSAAATRDANSYLAELGDAHNNLVVLIPDIGKSVKTATFAAAFPGRHLDSGIKELEATLTAMGLSAQGFKTVVSTFDGFTYIPFSAIRMADYGCLGNLGFSFTHAELIGEDGPSHLMTENLGAWLGLHNIGIIANPADLRQANSCLEYAVQSGEMFYLRLGRPKMPNIYGEVPEPGKADVIRRGNRQGPVLVATGQTVYNSLVAAEMLHREGIEATVINVAYLRPFDPANSIARAAYQRHVIVAEAHNPQVGLASLVKSRLLGPNGASCTGVTAIGINSYVPSAPIEMQQALFGLLPEQIYAAAKQAMRR